MPRLSRAFCRRQAAYYFGAAKAHALAVWSAGSNESLRKQERRAAMACLATARDFARQAGDLW